MSAQTKEIQNLINRILDAGKELAADGENAAAKVTKKSKELASKGEDVLVDKLGIEDSAQGRDALRKGLGAGAAAGALALLLGSRSGRKMVAIGGLAGLGTLAYKAYQKNGGKMPKNLDDAIGLLTGPKANARSEAILRAMVAAAKADGHVTDNEGLLISAHTKVEESLLEAALAQDPNAEEIASLSDGPQAAREIYAASCRVALGETESERAYLDSLAMHLKLDPELAARIETDVRTGS